MRRSVVGLGVAVLSAILVTATYAQQGALGSQLPQTPPPGQSPMQGGMCPMCSSGMCPMMGGMQGGMMGGGMMGMMGGQSDSPRTGQMRGEMMKALGEIMMKYGKMMEGGAR